MNLLRVALTAGVFFEGSTSDDGSQFIDFLFSLDFLCCFRGLTFEGPSSVSTTKVSFSHSSNSRRRRLSLTSFFDDLRQV